MQNLINDIKDTIEISESDVKRIITKFHTKTYKKSESIPCFGKTSDYMQFIEDGLIRVYTIDNQAKEVTLQIGIKNMWVNDLYSYHTQTVSSNYIVALQETTLLQIHRNDIAHLFVDVPSMESFVRIKLQESYIRLYQRTLKQFNSSAEERYLVFREKYGYFEDLVPQYIIASYLNISPEHLSKIRRQLIKN